MSKFTKYKPFYKKLIALKRNVLNTRKLFRFKKKKWSNFKFHARKALLSRKRPYKLYDHNRYALHRFMKYYKRRSKHLLTVRNRMKVFYFNLTKKYLTRACFSKGKKINKNLNFYYLQILESRLDVVLYRARFTSTIRSAQSLIKNRIVLVNNNFVTTASFQLNPGDLIQIKRNYWDKIKQNVLRNYRALLVPYRHLHINYRVLSISFFGEFKTTDFQLLYPFWLDLNSWVFSYKY